MIAAGLSGPRRPYAGAARDFVLGARLLTAGGEALRFGGEVIKNVAGFDVSRLLCGSLGILGVITEVSLKVLPRPRLEETLRLELPAAAAVASFNRWAALPLPLSGAAWWQGSRLGASVGRARGGARGARADRRRDAWTTAAAQEWWQALRHCRLPPFAGTVLWRLSVPPAADPLPLPGQPLIDWGGALRWYAECPPGLAVRDFAVAAGGTALCWRGAAPRAFHPLSPAVARLHQRLKERFDPHGIFNPGRLLAGL